MAFWGTPEFALPTLRALLGEGHDVVAVVTKPDRPAGRGRRVHPSPVKRLALEHGIPVLQPERAGDAAFIDDLRALEPEVSVVAAYGLFLPAEALDLPPLGSLNVHPSLLPDLRGAAPVQWALMLGRERTGVTVIRLVEEMDAGPILFQVEEPIDPEDSASELAARLSELGAEALVETLALLELGEVDAREQDDSLATFAPRIERDDARVRWSAPAAEVSNRMRGLDDAPGAWTLFGGRVVKVYRPRPEPGLEHDGVPGTVLEADDSDNGEGLLVACGEGAVRIREVKPSGRRRMGAAEWIRGRGPAAGDRFDV